jgi:DNA-binding IclR family transcriptional regulator
MINSVRKAIRILNVFSVTEPSLSLREISARVNMPKSTVHNLLNTLIMDGMIEKVDHDNYALGIGIIALTQSVRVNVELRDRAAPILRNLADSCRESVYLTIRDEDRVLYIYAIESSQRLQARTAVGDRVHMHCTSTGKAVLSALSDKDVDTIIDMAGMPAFTPKTITDRMALRDELLLTRKRGYSVDNEEHEVRTYCLGAPIFDAKGQVIGSCSISGRNPDILGAKLDYYVTSIRQASHEISRHMGFVPTTLNESPCK